VAAELGHEPAEGQFVVPLDSPRWFDELWPVAGDVEDMLEDLAALRHAQSDDAFKCRLTGLMQMIWHDNDSCPAALAVAPHLAAICEGADIRRRVALIRCIALFEDARHDYQARGIEYEVQADVREEYGAILARLPELIAACLGEPWDSDTAVGLAGALVVAKGHPAEGREIMSIRPQPEPTEDHSGRDADEIPW
jgi:hypothetical protein